MDKTALPLPFGAGAPDAMEFAGRVFGHYCGAPFNRMHRDLFAADDGAAAAAVAAQSGDPDAALRARRGRRSLVIAPRGAAKTTLCTLILPLYRLCCRRDRYIVIISATQALASRLLAAMADELWTNALLAAALGSDGPVKMTAKSVTAIEFLGFRVESYGAASAIRGIKFGPWRPTHIILDDVESDAHIASGAVRAKLRRWYDAAIEPLGDTYTDITVVGTLLHSRSLLNDLRRRPNFETRLYRSVLRWSPRADLWQEWERLARQDAGMPPTEGGVSRAQAFFEARRELMLRDTQVLWPEKESYADLMALRLTMGAAAFSAEKQNAPEEAEADIRPMKPERWLTFVIAGGSGDTKYLTEI